MKWVHFLWQKCARDFWNPLERVSSLYLRAIAFTNFYHCHEHTFDGISLQSCFVSPSMSSRKKKNYVHLSKKWPADMLKIQRLGLSVFVHINCSTLKTVQHYLKLLNFIMHCRQMHLHTFEISSCLQLVQIYLTYSPMINVLTWNWGTRHTQGF